MSFFREYIHFAKHKLNMGDEFNCGPPCIWPMEEKTPCNPSTEQKTECVSFFECSICFEDTITPITGTAFDTVKTYLRDLKMCKGCTIKVCGTCYEGMVSASGSNAVMCPGCRRPDPWMMSQAEKKTFFQGKLDTLNDQAIKKRFQELLADDPRPLWRDWTLPTPFRLAPSVAYLALVGRFVGIRVPPADLFDGFVNFSVIMAYVLNAHLYEERR
jgi:hypothetical protein